MKGRDDPRVSNLPQFLKMLHHRLITIYYANRNTIFEHLVNIKVNTSHQHTLVSTRITILPHPSFPSLN
uniref:Uncharacterized protein n=1 Tax=Arundo donax TaxID=35708 RepID=A0A0A8YHW3_ARUDO